MVKRTTRSINADRRQRSKQAWERGRGAPKKGNPRYRPIRVTDRNGNVKKVYVLR